MQSDSPASLSRSAVASAVLLSAMWGLNIVGIKVSLAAFPPIWNAFWRMLLGWPILWAWARATGTGLRLRPGETGPMIWLGLVFAVQIITLNLGVGWTSAAFAAVLLNAAPVFVNVIAHFLVEGDRLSARRSLGIALAFAGVAFAVWGRPDAALAPRPVLGNVICLVTAAMIAGRIIYTKGLLRSMDPTKALFWQVAFSLPVFLACAFASEPLMVGPLTRGPLLAWLYCSVGVVGLGFILWARLLQANSPSLLSIFVFPTPIFGILFSAMIYGERPSLELAFGVIGVASGILLVTLETHLQEIGAGSEIDAPTPQAMGGVSPGSGRARV